MAISHTWRDVLLVHPAANMFPMMSETELRELGKDIRQHGLREPIVITLDDEGTSDDPACYRLLDGRNRLDAMELATSINNFWRARGRDPEAEIKYAPCPDRSRKGCWCVKTNMIGGYPRRRYPWVK